MCEQRVRSRSIINELGKSMKHTPALVAVLCLMLTACVSSRSDQVSHSPERSFFLDVPQEDHAIYLAVLDRMFARWESDGPKLRAPARYYIKVQNGDAPPDLLAALRAKGREVFPASAYEHGRGVELSLGEVERKGNAKASVYGGYLFGPLGGEWGPFILSRQQGEWIVVSWEPTWFAQWNGPSRRMERIATLRHTGCLRTRCAFGHLSLT